MLRSFTFRRAVALAGVVTLGLVTAGCGDDGDGGSAADVDCSAYDTYGDHDGKSVSIYTSIRDIEADNYQKSWEQFEQCTGLAIDYEGSGEFEAQLQVRVQGGNAPDLAFIPQPGLLERFAKAGQVKAAPAEVKTLAEANYPADWLKYATVNGTFYGAPMSSNVKSFVWYSPTMFQAKGWTVPSTWADLMTLSATIAGTGMKPWCAGIESGDATGWPATDWVEDVMLRTQGTEVYDQWVTHEIPFDDPKVAAAVDVVGGILKNDTYVNGGYGGPSSITTTAFQEGGTPITRDQCALHRQASFYANFWPEGTKVGENEDVFAFYLPTTDPTEGKPVLAGGEFVTAFADRPEVKAVQTYLASPEYANGRARFGNWASGSKGLDLANVPNPIDKESVEILRDPQAQIRFDASDLMPAAVGAGTFWKGMVDWINGKSTAATLAYIESSWPN